MKGAFILLLFLLGVFSQQQRARKVPEQVFANIKVDWSNNLRLLRDGTPFHIGRLGDSMLGYELHSSEIVNQDAYQLTFSSEDRPNLILDIVTKQIQEKNSTIPPIICQKNSWKLDAEHITNGQLEYCFSLENAYWYGGNEDYSQQFWPINNQVVSDYRPYLTGLYSTGCAVMERFWLSTTGISYFVDDSVQLFVKKNQTEICFLAQAVAPYSGKSVVELTYDYCMSTQQGMDIYMSQLHMYMMKNYMALPSDLPDTLMMEKPIWSTWAVYKKEIDANRVIDFAKQILANNYSNSQLEIDDKWQTFYGDFKFNGEKFPNIQNTIRQLKKLGFRTTLWVHPFANLDSSTFYEETSRNLSVRDKNGTKPMLTKWWDGVGTSIDPTNPKAADWFVNKLNELRNKTGIDSFKFDAGEVNFLTNTFSVYNESVSPNQYSNAYARMAARVGNMIEVRIGSRTQDLPIFVRMLDKDSKWGIDNGLKSVLTTALVMGFTGYNYILPDMIGGNAYSGEFPDAELFVRWTQLTAFLPAMQFSIPPWHYKNNSIEVNEICRNMVALHEQIVFPRIFKAADIAIKTGAPIIRPIWYFDNSDKNMFTIDDQFLIGNEIMVAPVLNPQTYQRDIYIPSGAWQAARDGAIILGPKLIKNYPAPIDEIPYFFNFN